MPTSSGKLIICPTPIGNLGDVTQRMREALASADVVCAEDTRVTGKLLSALGITKRLERLDETVMGQRAERIVERVAQGEVIAYCSDAGMPGVSDPGLRLVAEARKIGVPVEVLPGPSAVDTAYVASGATNPRFYFGGFLPKKEAQIEPMLAGLASLDAALIFYESPNRLVRSLACIARVFPFRYVAVCRELTKLHEEVVGGLAPEVAQTFAEREAQGSIRGEIAVVIDGASDQELQSVRASKTLSARERAIELRAQGVGKKDVQRALIEEFGLSRNEAYALALEE